MRCLILLGLLFCLIGCDGARVEVVAYLDRIQPLQDRSTSLSQENQLAAESILAGTASNPSQVVEEVRKRTDSLREVRGEAGKAEVPPPATELHARFLAYLDSLLALHEGLSAALTAATSTAPSRPETEQPDLEKLLGEVAKTTDSLQAEHQRLVQEFRISVASSTATPQR